MKTSFTPIIFAIKLVSFAFVVSTSAIAQTSTDTTTKKAPAVQTAESQAALTPASVLEKLKKGNTRFVEKNMRSRDWQAKVPATAAAQYPFAAILACMDSRNPIEIIFDQGIGDVFGIRIAGNIVNEDELGSMEYATKVVGVKLLVVLGHTSCGAVKGAIDDAKLGNLTALLAKIRPAVSASGPGSSKDDAYVTKVAQANVSQAMKEIREKSPTIKAQLDAGTVGLVGAIYDVSTGKVTFMPD
jgi:carbonic anhydrase